MVFHAADDQGGAFPFFEDAGLVGPEAFADRFGNPGLPVFGAVDEMDQVFDQGLRRGRVPVFCFALSGLVVVMLPNPRAALRG